MTTWGAAIALVIGVAGCADVETGAPRPFDPDTTVGVDYDAREQGCELAFGRTFALDRLEVMGAGEGFDLDGDGVIDNSLAFLAPLANPAWRASMASGDSNYLFDFTPWVESLDAVDDDMGLAFYNADDADDDPSNNRSGEGEFTVSLEQFDVTCEPTSRFDIVSVDTPTVAAFSEMWTFYIPESGTAQFADMELVLDVAPDMATLTGSAGAQWTLCGLSTSPFPGAHQRSFLDVITQEFGERPDIDRDGDGLERVVYDGQLGLVACIDGDGTELSGDQCACDPRIADAFSIAFRGSGVAATIVDVTSVWE